MAYSKQGLIENLVSFKREHGQFPTHSDFKNRIITPSRNVYYRKFGSMEEAIKQAELYEKGDLFIEDEPDQKPTRSIRQDKGAQCPFCGNQIRGTEEFYSSFTRILIMRFMDRLKSSNGDSYSDGVLDCIKDVFGIDNLVVRRELAVAGYLEMFLMRNKKKDPEEVIQES